MDQHSDDSPVLPPDDAAIVARCLAGCPETFAELVDRYERVIYNLIYRMVRDSDEACDITQDVFVRAYERLHTFDPRFKFFSWLYRIAVNCALNHLHRRRRQQPVDAELRWQRPGPDADCVHSDMNVHLQRALAAVALDYRVVLILKHFVFLSYREIGELLDLPEKTVKSRLYSGRQLLKDALVQQGWTG
jgi:RNA polymerase sigma-70 factor (ECF subfamily)